MNDKDKEEFQKWWEGFVKKDLGINVKAIPDCKVEKAWQAACEYKQKEIDELKTQDQIIAKEIKTYMTIAENLRTVVKINQDENAKLRECLSNWLSWEQKQINTHGEYCGEEIKKLISEARQILKELEEK